MSKKHAQKTEITVEQAVMDQITAGTIVMRPRWYFVLGSITMSLGMIGVSIGAIFLFNLSFFLLRQHGPMGEWRLKMMLETFPWYIPILAAVSVGFGVWLLKKYDISYKYNFKLVVLGFIAAVWIAAWLIDVSGINATWFGQGQMKRLYRQNSVEQGRGQPGQGNHRLMNDSLNSYE